MLRKIIVVIMFFGFVCSFSFAADDFSLLKEERIGDLRINLSEKHVSKAIKCALKRGPDELWAADGAYHQEWKFAACGITLDMVSEKKGGLKSIGSIILVKPARLSTKQGIRIGSSEQEVMNAYKTYWNKEDSKHFESFVAGSIYGGLIFKFRNGKVNSIFLGAAAE
jgi:hypothetical protein